MSLLQQLVERGVITAQDIPTLEEEARTLGGDLEAVLINHGISPSEIQAAQTEPSGLPTANLVDKEVPFEVLKLVPEESVANYRFAPIGVTDGVLEIGIVDPDNIEARDAVSFIASKLGMPYKLFLISAADFEQVLQSYKGLSGQVTEALSEFETDFGGAGGETISQEKGSKEPEPIAFTPQTGTQSQIVEEAPVTKIVATILHYASEGDASDIHIEPIGTNLRVRFRVDGVLTTSLVLPAKVQDAVLARIKILSNMRLDEKRKPQDGRFSATIENRRVDFRVSTFPTYYGEKVVLRILDTAKGVKPLSEMGLSERTLSSIKDAIARPYGLVLISGPTGSGKSTTLYSMLNEIDREKFNVLSLEDPIEYNISGVSQSQVRPEIGYTFATGLRNTLRQDPDIIMVGEIRDKETAQLAVQAALTGHLVFSTIHTNNAAGVIPRLIDMGVDPFLIAPTLVLAMAQRLVQMLCPNSGAPLPVEGSIKAEIDRAFQGLPDGVRRDIVIPKEVLAAHPSSDCPKGTRGRTAVFEVLAMNRDLEKVILEHPTEVEIMRVARLQGMLTMQEDAMLKAFRKEIPWEEVNKL